MGGQAPNNTDAVFLIERQRAHWSELHSVVMSQSQLEKWIDRIPGYDTLPCNCEKHFYKLLENNPPRFDDWYRWTWEIHNAVNLKLGKQLIAWTDAIQLWGWSIKDIPDGNAEDSS